MLYQIPINPDLPSQTMRVVLDKRPYRLRFDWNERGAYWTMSIFTDAEVAIVCGVRLAIDWMPLLKAVGSEFPSGKFVVVDISGNATDPGRYDFGLDQRCQLWYESA